MIRPIFACLAAASFVAAPAARAEDPAPEFTAASAESAAVGDAYFAAYIGRDWDRLDTLLADDATFQDPTAKLVFGGFLREGRETIVGQFRKGFAGISRMEFHPERVFHAGNYAVFEGQLDWTTTLRGGVQVDAVMPLTTILRIEDGKVVEHRDYADYAPFLEAAEKALG